MGLKLNLSVLQYCAYQVNIDGQPRTVGILEKGRATQKIIVGRVLL